MTVTLQLSPALAEGWAVQGWGGVLMSLLVLLSPCILTHVFCTCPSDVGLDLGWSWTNHTRFLYGSFLPNWNGEPRRLLTTWL